MHRLLAPWPAWTAHHAGMQLYWPGCVLAQGWGFQGWRQQASVCCHAGSVLASPAGQDVGALLCMVRNNIQPQAVSLVAEMKLQCIFPIGSLLSITLCQDFQGSQKRLYSTAMRIRPMQIAGVHAGLGCAWRSLVRSCKQSRKSEVLQRTKFAERNLQ